VTKDVGQFAASAPPGTGRWEHAGSLLPYGGPDRCTSLVLHHDAGHREYDIWATEEMREEEYVAAIERLRRMEDVQWVLRKVRKLESVPPAGDGLIEHPRPPFSHLERDEDEEEQDETTVDLPRRRRTAWRWLRGRV
jgi:hypothetical protein